MLSEKLPLISLNFRQGTTFFRKMKFSQNKDFYLLKLCSEIQSRKEPNKNQKKFCYNKELLYFCLRIEFLTLEKEEKKETKKKYNLDLEIFNDI